MRLKLKKAIKYIINWLKGGVWMTTSNSLGVQGETGANVGLTAKSIDGTGDILLGVGTGGSNHGIYSNTMSRWMVYSDGTYTWFDNNDGGHFRWDMSTNNTTDTWVPVLSNGKLQHRGIPRNLTYDFSVQSGSSANNNISANGTLSLDINVSTIVSGYNASLMHFDTNSYDIVPIRADLHGTILTLYFKNLTNAQKSFTTYYWIMRWKTIV